MSSNKQYGLQLPKKASTGLVQKHSAFGDDSDSEKSDGGGTDWTKRALKASDKSTVKRQTKIEMQRALEEDTTVYQYDEVYDQLQKGKQDKSSKEKERKPKYIEKLMAAAEKRKIENERRIERQVQKEREAEGDEFKDKETFVTSAYKKKLEEFAKLDAEQKRQDMLEEIGDVTKQQDMGGFYRHLYQTTVDSSKDESPSKSISREENEKEGRATSRHSATKEGSKDNSPNKVVKSDKNNSNSIKKVDSKKDSRKYRRRKDSESSQDKNKDADTDVGSSSSSSSSSSDSESGEDKSSQSETENPKRLLSKRASEQSAPVEEVPRSEPPAVVVAQPEVSIWEKRTVGPVFEAALKRYYERKSARLAAGS